jgi:GWxTD domain-containing protein
LTKRAMEIIRLWMNMMRTKFLCMFLFLLCVRLIASEKLGMFIEVKRYFVSNKNTKFVIDYQVPYKNLMFMTREKGYFAELKVKLSIANADSTVYSKEFVNNIGVTAKYDVSTSSKSFLDRISLTLAKPGFRLYIVFEDANGAKSFAWDYTAELLNSNDRFSDIELVSGVYSDTTAFSQKFQRLGKIYIPEPSGLISRDINDSLIIYCEAYDNKSETANAVLTIKKNGTTNIIKSFSIKTGANIPILFPINLDALEAGKYTGNIDYVDHDVLFSKLFEFIITEQSEKLYFLFPEPDDEYQLIKYLIAFKSQINWNSMSKEAKRRNISQLWVELSSKLGQPVEAVLKNYKERVDYCIANYSHFEKGWKTDMGRIYIRNGRPDEIDDDTTSDDTRFVRKDFQIWKYSSKNHAVYVFVDIPMNGNFKLVYAKNDEDESTYPDWRKYLGTDFDESRLEN